MVWEIVGVQRDRQDMVGGRRIAVAMQKLGFRRMTVRNKDGQTEKGWGRGVGQRDMPDTAQKNQNVENKELGIEEENE